MEKEFVGVSGYKAIVDGENLFLKSTILKQKCYLPHIEWVKLDDVNFQGRGILHIITDLKKGSMDIVFKRDQYESMKELYNIFLPYMRRLIIDESKKQITILNKGNDDTLQKPLNNVNISNPYTYLSFDDINSYEVICDKQVINNDMLKNSAAGKYVAGDVGTLIGTLSSLNSGEFITNLQIKLNVNNFDNPCVYINYITRKIKSNGQMAKDLINMCNEDLAKLEIILKKDKPVEKTYDDPIEKVKKLKELLDMGILTQEEFDKKKKELLNL